MSLTKADIVETIATQSGFAKAQASQAVQALLELIKNTLASGPLAKRGCNGKTAY